MLKDSRRNQSEGGVRNKTKNSERRDRGVAQKRKGKEGVKRTGVQPSDPLE